MAIGSMDDVCQRGIILKSIGFILTGLVAQSTYKCRVPQYMSPRRNWDSPNPFLANECAPPPRTGGEGTHSPVEERLGESQFLRLEKKLSTLPTLWLVASTPN